MADLHVCVKRILCGLSDAVLRSLQAIIDGQIALLEAQIVIYQAQILQYDVAAIPAETARVTLQSIVDQARSVGYLLPINLITNCVPLGEFGANLTAAISVTVAKADEGLAEISRLLSYREELNFVVNEINETIDQFTNIRSVIDECLSGG